MNPEHNGGIERGEPIAGLVHWHNVSIPIALADARTLLAGQPQQAQDLLVLRVASPYAPSDPQFAMDAHRLVRTLEAVRQLPILHMDLATMVDAIVHGVIAEFADRSMRFGGVTVYVTYDPPGVYSSAL